MLAAYKKNVAKMVADAQAAGIKVILLAPTVIVEDANAEGNKRLTMYVEAEKQIAAEKKCQFVDLHGMFLTALKQKPAGQAHWLTADDVHMQSAGQRGDGGRGVAGPGSAGREDCGLAAREVNAARPGLPGATTALSGGGEGPRFSSLRRVREWLAA